MEAKKPLCPFISKIDDPAPCIANCALYDPMLEHCSLFVIAQKLETIDIKLIRMR